MISSALWPVDRLREDRKRRCLDEAVRKSWKPIAWRAYSDGRHIYARDIRWHYRRLMRESEAQ